ncbi:MAG: diguanylate cyclase [Cereibacter sphaeroides]|uniref:Diguanylate cyclase n=1 Tax=Cereibacter sphaeroides TaxID=1063 RepID=A0A2W5UF38_CERSP|nr:MAG: diguanylate cyclase [Cereibacter sphaeroides]
MKISGLFLPERWAQAGQMLRRPEAMAFLPALTLAAFWFGGEAMLILTALGLPLLLAIVGSMAGPKNPKPASRLEADCLASRPELIAALDRVLQDTAHTGRTTACLVVLFDETNRLIERHGRLAQTELLQRCADRLFGALRQGDTVARLVDGGLAVALGGVKRLDLEALVQVAARLQAAISAPISLNGAPVYVSCSIGFCLVSRAPEATGLAMVEAAQIAAEEALRHGPAAIRSFAPGMARARNDREAQRNLLEAALDDGQIHAYFQPQISTDTGAVSGFEALARWQHPERGIVGPAEFLADIEEAGLSERLGEVMLYNALSALAGWDKAGLQVPTVAVNFSAAELRDPRLPEKIKWELDRFDLSPERLTVEILETVVTRGDNDVIVRNVAALSAIGCGVDLDDFGTGHTSIVNIRRFALRRIKIDRSFVTRVDEDREQQKIVSAILSMSERLGLQSLAEGVETPGEHAMMAQLGCGHVQGFGIGRPMPYEDTAEWMIRHNTRLGAAPKITHRAG